MAEAIVAIGLLSSVIQVSDFAKNFLRRLKEYHDKTNRLPLAFQAIQIQLPLILEGLEGIEASTRTQEKPQELDQLVQPVLDACRAEIQKLDRLFSHVCVPSNASSLKKSLLAVKTFRYNDDIQQSAAFLKNHVETLMFYQINRNSPHAHKPSLETIPESSADAEAIYHLQAEVRDKELDSNDSIPGRSPHECASQSWHLQMHRCTCRNGPFLQNSTEWNFGPSFLSSQLLSSHNPSCPHASKYDAVRRFSFQFSIVSLLLKKRLCAAISINLRQGIVNVDPKLELRGVQRKGSPAFALVKKYAFPKEGIEPLSFERFRFQMRQLLQEGSYSPHDLDESGDRLIDAATFSFPSGPARIRSLRHQVETPWIVDQPERYLSLVSFLQELGVSLCEPLNAYCSLIGYILRHSAYSNFSSVTSLITTLIAGGAEMDLNGFNDRLRSPFRLNTFLTITKLMRSSPTMAEYFGCNPLQSAILRRSWPAVESLIMDQPHGVSQENIMGQNSLHLAFDWPAAAEMLLSTGAESHKADLFGSLPITYACYFRQLETVNILLARGCPIQSGYHSPNFISRNVRLGYSGSALHICQKSFDRDIMKAVAANHARRRRDLLRLAQTLLSEDELKGLVPTEGSVPDTSALALYKAVVPTAVAQGVYRRLPLLSSLENTADIELAPVYHSWNGCGEGAEILYEAGFKTIWPEHKHGRNVLLQHRSLRLSLAVWYHQKSGPRSKVEEYFMDLGQQNEQPSIHWLIQRCAPNINKELWKFLFGAAKEASAAQANLVEILTLILNSEFQNCKDACRCSCTTAGCEPITILLKIMRNHEKGTLRKRSPSSAPMTSEGFARWLRDTDFLLYVLQPSLVQNKTSQGSRSLVRSTLFEMLSLTHLCCFSSKTIPPRYYGQRDVYNEIVSDEEDAISQFESLVPLAQSAWEKSCNKWLPFWRDFFVAHVDVHWDLTGEAKESYTKSVRALGVLLEEESQTEHECTWMCWFDWPPKVGFEVEEAGHGESTSTGSLDVTEPVAECKSCPEDSEIFEEACPFYDERKQEGWILPV